MKTFAWVLAASALLVGCAASKPSPVGVFTAKPPSESTTATLDIKSDNTFILSVQSNKIEGKWTYAEPTLTLNYEKIDGKSMAELEVAAKQFGLDTEAMKKQDVTMQSDGTLLFTQNDQQLVFKRS